ncbi:Gfo/Idh/MocA family oxidoreductase [Alienimonas chondri]|uniref:Scyllo-inositol 2-dehydrogenase (NAD(+)) n=1 Tax=Alienimonas chondri TaxID=2681879 RepID=A0ABX1VD38_9PLAN|nr:Gfo/Idh/MocA family oxidoreductase [Alienimonas chondri]NNJ25964.1 scyllo-inositol 2-dehydrogenase (NAD(+)) [Alienimonas chondri]
MSTLNVAVAGVGALGRHHARILAGLDGVNLVAVADRDTAAAEKIAADQGCRAVADIRDVLDEIDAVSVATPTFTHADVAGACLAAGKHVLVEKPLSSDVREAEQIALKAKTAGVTLAVGHIERFNPAYEEVAARCSRPRYARFERVSPFAFRSVDVGAVHDLMIHDLELARHLFDGAEVVSVQALGTKILTDREDAATARLTFECGGVADLTANRVNPTAARTVQAFGADGVVSADLTTRRVLHYTATPALTHGPPVLSALDDPTADRAGLRDSVFGRWIKTEEIPVSGRDALTAELSDWTSCCRTGSAPRVDGAAAVAALELAEWVLEEIAASEKRAAAPVRQAA